MAIYQDCSEADRPKVFGMTACPTWTPDARQTTSLAELENCLNAKIVTVEEHLDEFALYSSKPIEVDQYGDVTVRNLDLMLSFRSSGSSLHLRNLTPITLFPPSGAVLTTLKFQRASKYHGNNCTAAIFLL
jgi:hypothetical protein